MSLQPTASLGGSEIPPPVVSHLKYGSGPVHIGGQHSAVVEEDAESEDNEEEDVKSLSTNGKRSTLEIPSKLPQKKVKLAASTDEEVERKLEKKLQSRNLYKMLQPKVHKKIKP